MYKKIAIIAMCFLLLIATLTSCGKKQQAEEKEKEETAQTVPTTQTVPTMQDATETTTCHLLSRVTDSFEKLGFSDNYKKSSKEETKGTLFTVLLETTNTERANEIEKVTIKDTQKNTVNVETNTYVLNNNRGCVIFFKTEGDRNASDYFVHIKSYTGKEKYVPIPENEDKKVVENFATQASQAKFGDIILLNDTPYFIMQSGVLNDITYTENNKQYSSADMGVVLISLHNTLERKLKNEDFAIKFYDVDKMGDNGVVSTMQVNANETLEKYKNNFHGLFAEIITCNFKVVIEKSDNAASYIARRNYVINNTWLQQVSNKDIMYKIASIAE